MDIEESKELLKKELANTYSEKKAKAIEVLLTELDKDNNIISDLQNEVTLKQCELDKKDKIINDMSEQLAGLTIWNNEKEEPLILIDKQEVINYFTNKVEENK